MQLGVYLTSPTIYPRTLESPLSFICVPPTDTSLSCVAVDSTHTVAIAGQTVWNSLPNELKDPACGSDRFFCSFLRPPCSISTTVTSGLEVS